MAEKLGITMKGTIFLASKHCVCVVLAMEIPVVEWGSLRNTPLIL